VSECYYFGGNGYLLTNMTTPDGYTVNGDGQWTEHGNVKTQGQQANAVSVNTAEGSWEPVGNRWKIKKPDGSYVVDQLWLIDSDRDGVYNMYSFDENGFLHDTNSDKFDHGQFGGYGSNKFGGFDAEGRMLSNNYHGNRMEAGPYEAVKKNGLWTDVSGMIGSDNYLNIPITDNYYIDALGIQVGVMLYDIAKDVSGTVYKN